MFIFIFYFVLFFTRQERDNRLLQIIWEVSDRDRGKTDVDDDKGKSVGLFVGLRRVRGLMWRDGNVEIKEYKPYHKSKEGRVF